MPVCLKLFELFIESLYRAVLCNDLLTNRIGISDTQENENGLLFSRLKYHI